MSATWPGETQVFSRDECFLCATSLGKTTRTDEHVFAKWVQHAFDLWDLRLTLLNGTEIPYRYLTIPCCLACNSGSLSAIEDVVGRAVRNGADAVRQLPDETLFLWLAKISYGLLHREHFLAIDQKSAEFAPIIERAHLEQFRMHHYLLQRALDRVHWNESPASIAIFNTQTGPDNIRENFDFNDGPFGPFLAIRIGSVGIVAVLQDWGAMASEWPLAVKRASALAALSPLQFREVSAHVRYAASLFNRTPKLIVGAAGDGRSLVRCLPLGGLAGGALYNEFDGDEFARVLAFVLGVGVSVSATCSRRDRNLACRQRRRAARIAVRRLGSSALTTRTDCPVLEPTRAPVIRRTAGPPSTPAR